MGHGPVFSSGDQRTSGAVGSSLAGDAEFTVGVVVSAPGEVAAEVGRGESGLLVLAVTAGSVPAERRVDRIPSDTPTSTATRTAPIPRIRMNRLVSRTRGSADGAGSSLFTEVR